MTEPDTPLTAAPPNDADAELAVISSIVFEPEAMQSAYELVTADDFYRHDYRACFSAMVELYSSSKPIDLVTLKNRLEERGEYEQIGGRTLLSSVATAAATSANITYYAKIVADKAMRRRMILLARDIDTKSRDDGITVEQLMELTQKAIFEMAQNRQSRDVARLGDVLMETMDKIEEVYKSGNTITGIKTGLIDFDNMTAGLHNSDLILIAARPSMGKTALALNIALHAAAYEKVPTVVFSLEMSNIQVAQRFLSSFSMVEATKLKEGKLSGEDGDWMKIVESIGLLHDAPLFLDDTPAISVTDMLAKCRRLKLEHNLGLIVVDYLQLMSSSSRRVESRQNEVAEISRALKALAREVNVPVIALSQLSRGVETRGDKRPVLSDLRDSGAIEQDADLVCFIYRDEYYTKEESEKRGEAELIIAKHRNGEIGSVPLCYLNKFVKFTNREYK